MQKKISLSLVFFMILIVFTQVNLISGNEQEEKVENKIIVYYFHWNPRCMTCNKIEKQVEEALHKYYKKQMKQGIIEFKSVDTQKKENKHFEKDYNLYTKSVVISKVVAGKEVKNKTLQKVWELVHNTDSYYQYIKTNVDDFLK